jgi:hypothetical protein
MKVPYGEGLATHADPESCAWSRKGEFVVLRQTQREIKQDLRRRLYDPVPEVRQWSRAVVRGHFVYYGVPRNGSALTSFRQQVVLLWIRSLRRRSQKHRVAWERMGRLASRWLPTARIHHPYPEQRLCVITRGRSPVR